MRMRSSAWNVEACCSFIWRRASSSAGALAGESSVPAALVGGGNSPDATGKATDREQRQVRRPAAKFGRLWRCRNMNDGLKRKLGCLPADARRIISNSRVQTVPHGEGKPRAVEGFLQEVQPVHHREALARHVQAVAADEHHLQRRLL